MLSSSMSAGRTALSHRHALYRELRAAPSFAGPLHCNRNVSAAGFQGEQQALPSSSGRDLLLTLERSVGRSLGSDDSLRKCAGGAFGAEVFPDLPVATTCGSMWRKMTKVLGQGSSGPLSNRKATTAFSVPTTLESETDVQSGVLKVMTVAANLRSMPEIEGRIIKSVTSSSGGSGLALGRPADALLLVSGSHPVRTFPGCKLLLPSSLNTLDAASRLRREGAIPPNTQLWAVANPNVERDASLAEQKAAHGATLFLTQPPFDMDSFASWVEDARVRGVWQAARLVVGHPMISSVGNLAFWMSLSSCLGRPACQQLLREFSAAEASDKQRTERLFAEFNECLVSQALGWSSTGGFHLMPITAKGKDITVKALQPGGYLQFCAARPRDQ